VKFLIDMPLSPQLTVWFRQQNRDAVHVLERGLNRASDTAILDYAKKEHRIVVTADLDYPRLLALSQADGPGLVLFRGGNYSEQEVVDLLSRVFETISVDELPHSIVVVEKGRIRRRNLPLRIPNYSDPCP